jgi:hypothetical protein
MTRELVAHRAWRNSRASHAFRRMTDVCAVGAVLAVATVMSSLRIAVLGLPLAAACVGNIQRSARVPHPSVPLESGQPLTTPAEISAGLSNVTDVVAPRVGDASQAVEVPSTEARTEARLRVRDRAWISAIYEHGFGATSKQPDPTQAPIGPGDVEGFGIGFGYSFKTSTEGLAIGTNVELMGWSVPYVEYQTCTSCVGNLMVIDHGRATPLTLGVGVSPSYKTGAVTVFGGVFARNHPTTERKTMDTTVFTDDSGDVQSGPMNLLVHAGVEVAIEKWLSALFVVHQDVTADPVRYGPGFGFALTARLGD